MNFIPAEMQSGVPMYSQPPEGYMEQQQVPPDQGGANEYFCFG